MGIKVFIDFDEMTRFLEFQDQMWYRIIQTCCVWSMERRD